MDAPMPESSKYAYDIIIIVITGHSTVTLLQ